VITGVEGMDSLRDIWQLLEDMRREIIGEEFIRDEKFGGEGVFNEGRWRQTEEPNVWVAVDACTTTGRGVVWYDESTGRPRREAGREDPGLFIKNTLADTMEFAFVLETLVVLEMLRATDLSSRRGAGGAVRRTVVRCVSDCAGAVVCIRKGYSRNKRACAIIREIYELLERHDAVLEMRWVPGIENVADQTSREQGLEDSRITASWEALKVKTLKLPKPKARTDDTDVEFQ